MKSLEYLAKEDPTGYFADPVDLDLVPGYRDVVSSMATNGWLRRAPWVVLEYNSALRAPPLCVERPCRCVQV